MQLKEKSLRVLESLSIFKFLNSSQLIRLGVAKHRPNLSRAYRELLSLNLIAKLNFWVDPKLWRLQNYYYLKPKAKTVLVALWYSEEKIRIPLNTNSMFFRDYKHRTHAIDFQIEMYLYLLKNWWDIKIYDTYYDKFVATSKQHYSSITKLTFHDGSYFIPDAVIKIVHKKRVKIFTFEIYNWFNTKRVLSQLQKHIKALQEGTASIVMNETVWSRVLLLFEKKEPMEAVMKRFAEDKNLRLFQEHFLFSYIDYMKSDFNHWFYYDYSDTSL